jgi:cytochrome c-type biogenesis protein CcmH/NrfG
MTGAKIGAIVMAALLIMYVALLANTGLLLLQDSNSIAKVMGALILVFPVFGFVLVIAELRFGLQIEKLYAKADQEGALPAFDIERRPSGRPMPGEADSVFDKYREQAQLHPDDWHSWLNLGLAYDLAADRRRARAAMRKAIALASAKKPKAL